MMMRQRYRQATLKPIGMVAALLVAALLSIHVPPARAENAVKIVVNDQPITTYDIQQRTRMLRVFTQGHAGEKEAIDQLINEKLMMSEAARLHIDVSDQEIDQEIAKRAAAAKLSPAQFNQAMRQAGIEPPTFRQFLRANMAWLEIVRARFRATINITDQDVAAALNNQSDAAAKQKTATEYMLQQILFIVPAGAPTSLSTQRLSQANAFRKDFKGCDQSVQQASGAPGIVVKPQVRRDEGSLTDTLKATLDATEVGGTTKPERVTEGFQVIAVCAKNEIPGETEAATAARAQISDERGQLLARRYLHDLRADAVIEYR
jgi:peptidyl-prolyl cis-trans isomerase SurA